MKNKKAQNLSITYISQEWELLQKILQRKGLGQHIGEISKSGKPNDFRFPRTPLDHLIHADYVELTQAIGFSWVYFNQPFDFLFFPLGWVESLSMATAVPQRSWFEVEIERNENRHQYKYAFFAARDIYKAGENTGWAFNEEKNIVKVDRSLPIVGKGETFLKWATQKIKKTKTFAEKLNAAEVKKFKNKWEKEEMGSPKPSFRGL